MPNWTFLALHLAHVGALALWVGGGFVLLALVVPEIRSRARAPVDAGRTVSVILSRFHGLVLGCIAILWITSAAMAFGFGRWSRWYAIQYACIGLMSASGLYASLVLSPRLLAGADADRSPDPEEQERYLRWIRRSLELDLACGVVAILFA